ncbi:hypothetical protein R84B8_02825 [Treponema sp. R8-4-B8]
MKKSIEEIGQLLNYEKLSAIRLLELPKIEKGDIPNFISCPKYEKAKTKLEQTMERYQSKVDRCKEAMEQTEQNIEDMKQQRSRLDPGTGFFVDTSDAQAVARYNDRLNQTRKMTDKINQAIDKYNDLLDKYKEAVEEANAKREELALEALLVIDEDIVGILDRCTKIVDKLDGSENPEDLVAAIDICLIELRIFAMFEEKIEDNAARKDCRERIAEVNKMFAALCANEQVMNHLTGIYQQNLSLVQKNSDIHQQVVKVLGSVDQGKLSSITQSVNNVISEQINTTFEYKGVIDPTKLDEIIGQITKTIAALNQSIVKANEALKTADNLAKSGVSAHKQAETLLTSMKANVEAMKNDILPKGHSLVQMIEEAVIDDFYNKELRPAVKELRQHLVGVIGEENLTGIVNGGEDRFSLEKTDKAIKQANLVRLQSTLDKVPEHVQKTTGLIAAAESDIQEAGKVPKQNADSLNTDLKGRYIRACFPVFGWISAIGIFRRVKEFESAFRSMNQIYRDLGNTLLVKNKKMTTVVMILGGILGLGGIAAFFILKLSNSVGVNVGVPGTVLLLYIIAVLILTSVGKKLRTFLGISARDQQDKNATETETSKAIK